MSSSCSFSNSAALSPGRMGNCGISAVFEGRRTFFDSDDHRSLSTSHPRITHIARIINDADVNNSCIDGDCFLCAKTVSQAARQTRAPAAGKKADKKWDYKADLVWGTRLIDVLYTLYSYRLYFRELKKMFVCNIKGLCERWCSQGAHQLQNERISSVEFIKENGGGAGVRLREN